MQWGIGRYLYAMGDSYVDVEERGRTKVIVKSEYRRLARAIQAQFEGKFDQMKAALSVADDEPDDLVPPKQIAEEPKKPAAPPVQDIAAVDDVPLEDKARARCELWMADIKQAGVVDDLRSIHADMNKNLAVYSAMGPEFSDMFKKAVEALGKRKSAIEANEAEQQAAAS